MRPDHFHLAGLRSRGNATGLLAPTENLSVAVGTFFLMGLQQLLGACCCPSWLPVSTPFSPALLRSMTRSCARQVVRRPVVLVGCRAGEH